MGTQEAKQIACTQVSGLGHPVVKVLSESWHPMFTRWCLSHEVPRPFSIGHTRFAFGSSRMACTSGPRLRRLRTSSAQRSWPSMKFQWNKSGKRSWIASLRKTSGIRSAGLSSFCNSRASCMCFDRAAAQQHRYHHQTCAVRRSHQKRPGHKVSKAHPHDRRTVDEVFGKKLNVKIKLQDCLVPVFFVADLPH